MKCQRCQSKRIAEVSGKCSDLCTYRVSDGPVIKGYVPQDLGIGGEDYLDINLCLDCGQVQGNFPLAELSLEKNISDSDVGDFFDNHFTEGCAIDSIPFRHRTDLICEANNLNIKFGIFVKELFEFNTVFKSGELKFPSCKKFVKMFRNNQPSLNGDW